MSEQQGHTLRIERTFEAPIGEVFEAWTSAEVLRRWFHPGPDWETPLAEVDLKVGGRIRVVMRRPEGTEGGAEGRFTVVERPRRLVFTWTFDSHPSNPQLIELDFSERDGRTTVVMVNSAIADELRRADQEGGWRGCLDSLERALAKPSS